MPDMETKVRVTLTIELPQATFRGLVSESHKHSKTVPERVQELITAQTEPMLHGSSLARFWAYSPVPAELYDGHKVMCREAREPLERALFRLAIREHLKAVGLRVVASDRLNPEPLP